MILYLIAENDIYDLVPYQVKSFNMNKNIGDKFLVQLAEKKVENEYVQKFGITNLEIDSSITTFLDAINYILYNIYIKPKINEQVLFIKNNIFSNGFHFTEMSRTRSWSAVCLSTKNLDENFLIENGKFVYINNGIKKTNHTVYRNTFIEYSLDDIQYIKDKFPKFKPNILKFDNIITLGTRFLKENKKFRDAGSPIRTKEEINQILNEVCKPCEYYTNGRCKLCGCQLARKLKYATAHCPINRW